MHSGHHRNFPIFIRSDNNMILIFIYALFFQVLLLISSAEAMQVLFHMGNKPIKQEKEETLVKIVPNLDPAYVRWLARDLERIHGFTPKNPRAVKPPDHYIEFMRLNGWLDVNLNDPDLAHLLK